MSEPIPSSDARTEPATAHPMDLPMTLTIDRDGRGGFVAKLPDRTLSAESLADLLDALFREFEDEDDRRAAAEARAEVEREGAIPWEQVKAELGL